MEKVCLVFTIKEVWEVILQNETEDITRGEHE